MTTISEISNFEKFIGLYNEVANFIELTPEYKHSGHKIIVAINELAITNRVFRECRNDLIQLVELRNALVHRFTKRAIAEPYPETIAQLQALHDKILRPITASKIAISPVISFDLDKSVGDALREMVSKNITNVPIIDDGTLLGVFSESSIVRWLDDNIQGDGVVAIVDKLRDIQSYLDKPEDSSENIYRFVSANKDIYSIRDMFDNAIESRKRLGAVFVTSNGKPSGKIIGIITAWDLYKIDQ